MDTILSTLCYIEKDDSYLMLHRTVKKHDVNKDKWIGVGGHFEADESPDECVLREVKEETGYTLTDFKFRGIVTFISEKDPTEYMHLYTATGYTGEAIACDEGELAWVHKDAVWCLNLWEGDKIFFRLLNEREDFFSLKLFYSKNGTLLGAWLDGKEMELFDIVDEEGEKTGIVRERGVAHLDGSLHLTVHTWIIRPNKKSGFDVLLQKRSATKDSNPGCYDISSAGHVSAGDELLPAARRELYEELGIEASEADFSYVGVHFGQYEAAFHGKPFRDYERSSVYIYQKPVDIDRLKLQEEEVESVCWMDYGECLSKIRDKSLDSCIYEEEFRMVGAYLGMK